MVLGPKLGAFLEDYKKHIRPFLDVEFLRQHMYEPKRTGDNVTVAKDGRKFFKTKRRALLRAMNAARVF